MPSVLDTHGSRDRMRLELDKLVGDSGSSVPAGFTQAMRSFLLAMEYDDAALMRSHLNAALESLVEVTNEAVRRRLGWPQRIENPCRRLQEAADQGTVGEFDDLGREIATRFDKMISDLTDLRDGSVKLLLDHGYEIEEATKLDEDIKALMRLKEETLGNWPWSHSALPPVDRQMLAESKAAFLRGERGDPVDVLIANLSGSSIK